MKMKETLKNYLNKVEKIFILKELEKQEGNRTKTAFILGISIRKLRHKLVRYGIISTVPILCIDRELMAKMYLEGTTKRKIAKHFNVTPLHIYRNLERYLNTSYDRVTDLHLIAKGKKRMETRLTKTN